MPIDQQIAGLVLSLSMNEIFGALAVFAGIYGLSYLPSAKSKRRKDEAGGVGKELRRPYHYEERNLPDAELRRKLNPRVVGKRGRYKVVLVDGTVVRDHIDPDFVAGGNPGRYGYVPMDELWVDDSTARGDVGPYVEHEGVESELMLKKGLSYDDAHERATAAERRLRKKPTNQRKAFTPW